MDANTQSNKHSVFKKGASINARKNSKSISAAHNARTVNAHIDDPLATQTTPEMMYVFFVECQT
jgi:hypothetical protein